MKKKVYRLKLSNQKLSKKTVCYSIGLLLIIALIGINQTFPLDLAIRSLRYALSPAVALRAYPQPSIEPQFDFSDSGTILEKRLKGNDARIVFNQSTQNGMVGNYWIANLDGSNPKKLNLTRGNTPLNNLTYEWIFFINKQRSISAYSYKTRETKVINPPLSPGYVPTIFNVYFSPDLNFVTFNVSYTTQYCNTYGRSAGCESIDDVPGAKAGVYSYNMSNNKSIYLGDIDYTNAANHPRWDEYEDGMYAHQNGKVVKIDLESGLRIDVPVDTLNQDFFKYVLSPNRKIAYVNGYLMDLASKSKKLVDVSGDSQYGKTWCNWNSWLSNKTLLCYLTIGETQDRSNHHYIFNLETGEKKYIVPGDNPE